MSQMGPALLLLVVSAVFAADYENQYERIKSHISKMRIDMKWTMGLNPRFRGMSNEQLKCLAGAKLQDISHLPSAETSFTGSLPAQFDSREKWSNCNSIKLVRDQSQCGSCWAVSSASVMSDRHCAATQGKQQPYVSDEYLLSCCSQCGHGCQGGWMAPAFDFYKNGMPNGGIYGSKTGCQPYSIPPNAQRSYSTPACRRNYCVPGWGKTFQQSLYYGQGSYKLSGEEQAMQDIYQYGPITAAFSLYQDFMYYREGVYHHASGAEMGGHAIKIIGWGEENGEKYWLIANSWNVTWGMQGLFKMRRGVNECDIEGYMITGRAKLRDQPEPQPDDDKECA